MSDSPNVTTESTVVRVAQPTRYIPGPAKPGKDWTVPGKNFAAKPVLSAIDPEMEQFTRRLIEPPLDVSKNPQHSGASYGSSWNAGVGRMGRSFFNQFTQDAIAATPKEVHPVVDPAHLATIAKETATNRAIGSEDPATLAALTFHEAGQRWIKTHALALRGRSEVGCRQNLTTLCRFLGALRVSAIHIGHINAYQKARIANNVVFTNGKSVSPWSKAAGPSIINHELSVLRMVLKRAGCWDPIAPLYQPLQEPNSKKQKVMSDIEERRFFAIAASRPEWELASLVVTITRHTSASGCELRNLRLMDVILDQGEPRIIVNGDTAKNNFRGRTICLNEPALLAVKRCIEMAAKKGSYKPEHYLFPWRLRKAAWNPDKPCTEAWLRRSWPELREATGYTWLTPHCFRHMCITGLLAKGVAPETVRHIAGHVTEEMMRHYSHDRHEDQKRALDKLAQHEEPARKPRQKAQQKAQAAPLRSMLRGRRYLPLRAGRRP